MIYSTDSSRIFKTLFSISLTLCVAVVVSVPRKAKNFVCEQTLFNIASLFTSLFSNQHLSVWFVYFSSSSSVFVVSFQDRRDDLKLIVNAIGKSEQMPKVSSAMMNDIEKVRR